MKPSADPAFSKTVKGELVGNFTVMKADVFGAALTFRFDEPVEDLAWYGNSETGGGGVAGAGGVGGNCAGPPGVRGACGPIAAISVAVGRNVPSGMRMPFPGT